MFLLTLVFGTYNVSFFFYKRNGTEVTAWNIRENIISQQGMSITTYLCYGVKTHDGAYMSIIPPLLLIISWSPLAIFQSVENDTIKMENTHMRKKKMLKSTYEVINHFFFFHIICTTCTYMVNRKYTR